MNARLKRRDVLSLLGGAAVVPLLRSRPAHAQTMPVVGFLGAGSPERDGGRARAFRQGLGEAGFVEGRNVTIDFRWAEGQNDQFAALAADLVRRQVAVIAALGGPSAALAAKAATTTIPVVFQTGTDPIEVGLVASLARPGGNVTGVTSLNVEVGPKRLEILRELVPTVAAVVVLLNPTNPNFDALLRDAEPAARALGLQLRIQHASTDRDFDAVFATLLQIRGALVIGSDAYYNNRSEQLAALTLSHGVAAISPYRDFALAGGLMSYGGTNRDQYRQAGVYAGRILKGEKPADLPVMQSTKVEMVLNLKTAQALGLTVPLTLLGRADEVIE